MRTTTILTTLLVGTLTAVAALILAGGPATGGGEVAGGGCVTDSYTTAVLERDRQMTAQMGATTATAAMTGDPMWTHSRDPAFLRALECQVQEVESMFGRVTPQRP